MIGVLEELNILFQILHVKLLLSFEEQSLVGFVKLEPNGFPL
jgi:hypothetical protein